MSPAYFPVHGDRHARSGVGCEVVPGIDDSGVEPQDKFPLEQEETSKPLEEEII